MRGRDLVMWSEGQWEASTKTAPDGADRQTDKQRDGHGNSKTNSAQRALVGEKSKNIFQKYSNYVDLPETSPEKYDN